MERRVFVVMILACGLPSAAALAGTISYVGTLADPNSVYTNTFVVVGSADLRIQTYGYGGSSAAPGGTNFVGT